MQSRWRPRPMALVACAGVVLALAGAAQGKVAAPRPAASEFSFVVLGDSQFHHPDAFNRIVDEVAQLYPAFVIHVGDMISGYVEDGDDFRAQWRRFQAQIAPLGRIPFLPVPGNHDVLAADRTPGGVGAAVYRETWGDLYYSFDYRNAHFVILNTEDRADGRIAGEQLGWLRHDLDRARRRDHIFVFAHRPIYILPGREELEELFRAHGVSAVICGHLHHYSYYEDAGIPYLVTTSATHRGTPFELAAGSLHHYLQVAVREGEFRIAPIRAGSVLPVDSVRPEDNHELYALERRFYSVRGAVLERLPQDDAGYQVELRVNNPTAQELTVYLEWQLPDARWAVSPLKGQRLVLSPGATDVRVPFVLRRLFPGPVEAYPTCVARALYLTSDGDVVTTEHTFSLRGGSAADSGRARQP